MRWAAVLGWLVLTLVTGLLMWASPAPLLVLLAMLLALAAWAAAWAVLAFLKRHPEWLTALLLVWLWPGDD